MKANRATGFSLAVVAILAIQGVVAQSVPSPQPAAPIPIDQLGAVAGKQYQGDGLSVVATPEGARLHCVFQRLEGEVTREGLWLESTLEGGSWDRLRVMAVKVGRSALYAPLEVWPASDPVVVTPPALPLVGKVNVSGNTVRFVRHSLIEEYSVSLDGVRQDFIIEQRPEGEGELRVELDVTGAKVEPLINGARLVLNGSGRKLAYNRLRVSDATGRELSARMEFKGATRLAVVVADASAVYPMRIDPTFSDADWISLGGFPGADNTVYAAATDSLGNLYVGGNFTNVGTVIANRIAKWDGAAWSALGSGMDGPVYALAIDGTNLYAGGEFYTAGGTAASAVAKWNGTTWSRLGPPPGVYGFVYALAVQGTNLYAGGAFSTVGFVNANGIAKWNGSTWSALGSGITNVVRALAIMGNDVCAGGDFTFAGGVAANRIAKWNGSAWSALGAGMNGRVLALAGTATNLVVGGEFSTAGGVSANAIAKWDGVTWTNIGTPPVGSVYALAVSGTRIFAGGNTWYASQNICEWNGSNWVVLGTGMESYTYIYALTCSGTNLYAGGAFISAGGTAVNRIARWSENTWSTVGPGINGSVSALAVLGGDLYAGGTFTTAGSVSANRIAKWNGNTWSALGLGVNGAVNALAAMDSDLYVGGNFNMAGGIPARGVAKWDGAAWTTLGLGLSGNVNALAVSDTNLFVAGGFSYATNAGPTTINTKSIAKWDGSAWSALGLGMDNLVYALAVSGTDLYAGGSFATADGISAQSIAKWDGNAWSALGTGMGHFFYPYVYALAAVGPDLYAGGDFTSAGGVAAFRIARWNGSNWFALGSGLNDTVNALAVSGGELYVGGYFTTAGGTSVRGIAKWHSTWSALGSGMGGFPNSIVKALVVAGPDLYVGGDFVTAGNRVSAYAARANISGLPLPGRFSNLTYSPATGFSCTFLDASVGRPYRVQTSPSLAAGSWTDLTNFTYAGPTAITAPSATTNKFLRAVTP